MERYITKRNFSRLFKQDTKGSLIFTHFQTHVRFSSYFEDHGICEDRRVTCSSSSGPLILKEELWRKHVISYFSGYACE